MIMNLLQHSIRMYSFMDFIAPNIANHAIATLLLNRWVVSVCLHESHIAVASTEL